MRYSIATFLLRVTIVQKTGVLPDVGRDAHPVLATMVTVRTLNGYQGERHLYIAVSVSEAYVDPAGIRGTTETQQRLLPTTQ